LVLGRLFFGRRRRKRKDEVRERPAPYATTSFSAELVPEQPVTGGDTIQGRRFGASGAPMVATSE
jgi:hypothetical protein